MTRRPPSLLAGFPGTDFPAFARYYGGAKTSRFLLGDSVSFVPRLPYAWHRAFAPFTSGSVFYSLVFDSPLPYISKKTLETFLKDKKELKLEFKSWFSHLFHPILITT